MAIDGEEDEILDLTPAMEVDGEDQDGGEATTAEDEALHIEIEGEDAEEETPRMKLLRAEIDRRNARIKDLEARVPTQAKIEVGKKPDLWDDCEGDADKFEVAVLAWSNRKAKADQIEREQAEQSQQRSRVFEKAHGAYKAKAAALGVPDFDDTEKTVIGSLPEPVQTAIVQYMDDPAKIVYALGKHPSALAKIAAESDPLRQILMIRDMEKRMTVTRKKPPEPEAQTIQRGSVSISGGVDKTLEKLEKEAERTNDRTKIIQYKMQQKAKAA